MSSFPPLVAMVTAASAVIPGLVVKKRQTRHRKSPKAFVSLVFRAFL